MGAVKSSPVQRSTWYRARRPLPAVTVLVLLSAVAGLVWVGVLNRPDPTSGGCQAAAEAVAARSSVTPAPVTPGQRLPPEGLDAAPPAPPQLVVVQVLNANGQRGEAGIVAAELAELGFTPTAKPTNDPLHPAFDLLCHGEIRFGAAGEAAARTLSLAVPCAELVRDTRTDGVVDLALGTEFTTLRPNDAAREALSDLAQLDKPFVPSQGGQAAGLMASAVEPELLREARTVEC
jgi:LytR cell envelope-related transcriptional attenuator